jgi:Sec-independent protein translocase protein TatA
VLGPEKLPRVVAEIGRWVGRARVMARQFREQLEEEVQLEEARKAQAATPPPETQPTPPETAPTPPETQPTPPETQPIPPETQPTPPETQPTPPELPPSPAEHSPRTYERGT